MKRCHWGEKKNLHIYILAFMIPCILFSIAMHMRDVFPFGEKSVLIWDLELQYKDYYSWLWDVLHGNASLQYSFSKSLGGNMVGIFSYYVSSIFNLGLLFIKKSQVVEYISWLTIFKISLSGVTCAYFLKKCFHLDQNNLFVLCVSTSYALMEYNVCYCRNLMWLDGVIFLPLVCLGVHRAVQGESGILLWFSTALTIICNWYTGYMVCLMSGIFFLFDLFVLEQIRFRDIRGIIVKAFRYVWYLLLGVLTSAAVLLPACLSLMGGRAEFSLLTAWRNMSFRHVLSGFALDAAYNNPNAPILYCGGFLLFLVIYGLLNGRIPFRKKAGYVALLLIIAMGFVFREIELLWTAFVRSSSYNYRFAFVDGFMMAVIAADVFETMKKEDEFRPLPVLSAMLLEAVIVGSAGTKLSISYAFWVCCYGVLVVLAGRFRKWNMLAFGALGVCLSVELVYNAQLMLQEYHTDVNGYREYVEDMTGLLNEIKAKDDDAYRFEKTYSYIDISRNHYAIAVCESLMLNYMSIEHYSSAYDASVDKFLANMGYSDYPLKNELMLETYWNSSILPADALLGIRYVLDNVQPYGYEKVEVDQELPEGYELYKNESALPLAFRISDGDMSGRYHEDPFVNQNTIFSIILGEEANLYTELRANKVNTEDKSMESYRIDINQDGPLYLYVDGSRVHDDLYVDNCELIVNGKPLQKICRRFRINAVYAGTYQKGDIVQVDIRHSTENKAHYIYAVQLNTDEFQKGIDSLRANNCVTDLRLEGATVSAVSSSPDAARILFTIPYDKGWTVKVDGRKAEYRRFANAFLMLDVEAGEHVIEMNYTVPGSAAGILLSLVGIVGFAGSDRWRKNKK